MTIGLGNDHRGYRKKKRLMNYLRRHGYNVIDYGSYSTSRVDYIEYAHKVCDAVVNNEANLGILICYTGIGMSIAANKINGIMCAKIDNDKEAELAKLHNNPNVLALSARKSFSEIKDMLDIFLYIKPLDSEVYKTRIDKIKLLEKEQANKLIELNKENIKKEIIKKPTKKPIKKENKKDTKKPDNTVKKTVNNKIKKSGTSSNKSKGVE